MLDSINLMTQMIKDKTFINSWAYELLQLCWKLTETE